MFSNFLVKDDRQNIFLFWISTQSHLMNLLVTEVSTIVFEVVLQIAYA